VGSHDTASAVIGLGRLDPEDLFVNVGTWSLAGKVYDRPCANLELAEKAALTHERGADGRFRVLANIPGFYVINRLHEELGIQASVPEWLATARPFDALLDLMRPEFFNPDSMVDLCRSQLARPPRSPEEWAFVALRSLAEAVRGQIDSHMKVTGTPTRRIRVGGGGSQSQAFCQMLAEVCQVPVLAGPAEATLAGNLGAQFLASGVLESWAEVASLMDRSANPIRYEAAS
jgi:rhamnulokinase